MPARLKSTPSQAAIDEKIRVLIETALKSGVSVKVVKELGNKGFKPPEALRLAKALSQAAAKCFLATEDAAWNGAASSLYRISKGFQRKDTGFFEVANMPAAGEAGATVGTKSFGAKSSSRMPDLAENRDERILYSAAQEIVDSVWRQYPHGEGESIQYIGDNTAEAQSITPKEEAESRAFCGVCAEVASRIYQQTQNQTHRLAADLFRRLS